MKGTATTPTTILPWIWGDPTAVWNVANEKVKADYYIGGGRNVNREYAYNTYPFSLPDPWGGTFTFVGRYGLVRFYANGSCCGKPFNTLDPKHYENMTRICFRNSNSYIPGSPSRNTYIQWLFAYLNEPYAFGGKNFGGKQSPSVYQAKSQMNGYGIDCSGLVCNCACWSGYPWDFNQGTGYIADTSHSTAISLSTGFVPGDILIAIKPTSQGEHVRTVLQISLYPDPKHPQVQVIEAVGSTKSTSTVIPAVNYDSVCLNTYDLNYITGGYTNPDTGEYLIFLERRLK